MIYSPDQIAKAYNTNLVDYFKTKGYACKIENSNSTRIKGFGGLIVRNDNSFYCFSNNAISGNNPIKCLQGLFNMSFPQAVRELINEEPLLENTPGYTYNKNSNSNV
ncbi:MAG: hypothetical protein FWG90_01775 [Oscillospiraceae bacterium]|nr:hypothetical protein [Oscillospiraceae bacterium]